jgi:preprotein translocase subunit SecE
VSSDSGFGATATFDEEPVAEPSPAAGGKGAKRPPKGSRGLARIPRLYREVAAEMRKVIWPTRRELIGYSTVVLAFVTAMVLIVAGLDYLFTKAVLAVFG